MAILLPVVCTKKIERAIQLYNICPKQNIISHGEIETIYMIYNCIGTQQGTGQDTSRDNSILASVEEIQ